MAVYERARVSGNGLPLDVFTSEIFKNANARDAAAYRDRLENTQRQVEAYNAMVTRRKRRQKRKALSVWAVRQPVAGALSAARSPSR